MDRLDGDKKVIGSIVGIPCTGGRRIFPSNWIWGGISRAHFEKRCLVCIVLCSAVSDNFWPTVLCKVAPLSQHIVCRLSSSVTFCIVACMTYRPQMFAPTRGFSGP